MQTLPVIHGFWQNKKSLYSEIFQERSLELQKFSAFITYFRPVMYCKVDPILFHVIAARHCVHVAPPSPLIVIPTPSRGAGERVPLRRGSWRYRCADTGIPHVRLPRQVPYAFTFPCCAC